MLLTISTTHQPATDLGFLLHKHPDRFQSFDLSFGQVHVFYPVADERQCSACLMLDVDPVEMARSKRRRSDSALANYVNDRPYVASSFMSTAISQVYGSALGGTCKARPELLETRLPLEVTIVVLPVKGGETFLRSVFQPLGYEIEATRHALDATFPEWGDSSYLTVRLANTITLSQLLNHLYVLIPVFDHHKHYFVGTDELDKLIQKGTGWLASHPQKEAITRRYLKFQPSLVREALGRLLAEEGIDANSDEADVDSIKTGGERPPTAQVEETLERSISLNEQRLDAVLGELQSSNAKRVVDLGCGEGKLLRKLLSKKRFESILGMDVSIRSLEIANRRLRIDDLPSFQAERIQLIHGSLMYRDKRLSGFDAAAVVEVIEHLDRPRLSAFERVVFQHARPKTVVITTPNSEYNAMWETLPAGTFRHADHRFEWTRGEFQTWANNVAGRYGYNVRFVAIGPIDERVGSPTQMGVFTDG